MKWFIIFSHCLSSLIFSQDVAEPLDAGLLLAKKSKHNIVVLSELFRRVGTDQDEFDIIVVVYGEHMSRASVVGIKGVSTGVITTDGKKLDKSKIVFVPHAASEPKEDLPKITLEQSPHKHEKMVRLAWELLSNRKIGVQSSNLYSLTNEPVRTCYFLVNSRLFENGAVMIGGYIQNPKSGTKSNEFLESVYLLMDESEKLHKKIEEKEAR